jgi:hypothetical protein
LNNETNEQFKRTINNFSPERKAGLSAGFFNGLDTPEAKREFLKRDSVAPISQGLASSINPIESQLDNQSPELWSPQKISTPGVFGNIEDYPANKAESTTTNMFGIKRHTFPDGRIKLQRPDGSEEMGKDYGGDRGYEPDLWQTIQRQTYNNNQ